MPLDRSTLGNNKVLTMSAMSNYTLWRLKNQLIFPRLARKHHEQIFSNQIIGNTIDVLKPFRVTVHEGRTIGNTDKYDPLYDETVQIRVNTRRHGRLKFNDEERTLEIRDFGDRYLQAVAEELANYYDEDGGEELGRALMYYRNGGDAYMNVDDVHHIRAYATEMSIPQNTRNYAILNPSDYAALASDIKPLNVPDEVKKSSIYSRFRGMLSNWYCFESVHVPYYRTGATIANFAPLVDGGGQGGSAIHVDSLGRNARNVFLDGQIIEFEGVNQLMVRGKKRKTGRRMPFVVTANVNASNTADAEADVNIYPELNDGTVQLAGIDVPGRKNVDALAADNAKVLSPLVDTDGTSSAVAESQDYRQSLFYERDALEFVHITLVPPTSATRFGVSTDPDSGTSVQYLEDFDFEDMETKIRVDIMYGVKTVYPEIGLRYIGGKVAVT